MILRIKLDPLNRDEQDALWQALNRHMLTLEEEKENPEIEAGEGCREIDTKMKKLWQVIKRLNRCDGIYLAKQED